MNKSVVLDDWKYLAPDCPDLDLLIYKLQKSTRDVYEMYNYREQAYYSEAYIEWMKNFTSLYYAYNIANPINSLDVGELFNTFVELPITNAFTGEEGKSARLAEEVLMVESLNLSVVGIYNKALGDSFVPSLERVLLRLLHAFAIIFGQVGTSPYDLFKSPNKK